MRLARTLGRTLPRILARALGELLVTAGAVLALFGGYQLLWTNVIAAEAQRELTGDLRRSWDGPDLAPRPAGQPGEPAAGTGLALLHIPRLGAGWVRPVVQGVEAAALAQGVGHYAQTALPGQVGNFAMAGHRATHGEPLRYLDQMRTGDAVIVETRDTWFTYQVRADPTVVATTALQVIAPARGDARPVPGERLLTLTTCHPRWSSERRMIVHATLVEERPRTHGPPPALTATLAGGA